MEDKSSPPLPRSNGVALFKVPASVSGVVDEKLLKSVQEDLDKALAVERAECAKIQAELAREKTAKRNIERQLDRERAVRILESRARKRQFAALETSIWRKVQNPSGEDGFVDERPLSEKYTPDDLRDYEQRRRYRLNNPTTTDMKNRVMYGDRWKDLIDVPLPKNQIPHPAEVKKRLAEAKQKDLMEQAEYESHRRRFAKIRRICDKCCECTCVCFCQCGKYGPSDRAPAASAATMSTDTTTRAAN